MPMDRPWLDALVDDDGSNTVGTVWNKTQVANVTNAHDGSQHTTVLAASATFAIGSGWQYPSGMTTSVLDSLAGYNGSATVRVNYPHAGLYLICASVAWASGGTDRGLQIQVNGNAIAQGFTAANPIGPGYTLAAVYFIQNGWDVKLQCYSDSATQIYPGAQFAIVRI